MKDSVDLANAESGSVQAPAPTRQKLTPAQVELFKAMERGVVVHFLGGMNAHYFRTDHKRVSYKTAMALVDKGWAVRTNGDWRGHALKIKEAP